MRIREIDGRFAFVPLQIGPDEIGRLLQVHRVQYPGADVLERQGAQLLADGVSSNAARSFVGDVCRWGGGHRLVDRVQSTHGDLFGRSLKDAVRLLDQGQPAMALAKVQELPFLGQAFASKQLRFLRPSQAVILDSVIRTGLGYSEDGDGYEAFLADCRAILDRLVARGLANGPSGPLRICDIEAAIYAKLQGYQ